MQQRLFRTRIVVGGERLLAAGLVRLFALLLVGVAGLTLHEAVQNLEGWLAAVWVDRD